MRKIIIIALLLAMVFCTAQADMPCICGEEPCTCFIQLGDEGPAVEFIQHALIAQGYLSAHNNGAAFDAHTQQAVLRFQEAHGLPATGVMDDVTLTLLLWGMTPEELDQQDPLSNGNAIWIPTDGGIRRHWKRTCSKMHDPRRVSVRNADLMDMQPCGRCNKNGIHELTGDAP